MTQATNDVTNELMYELLKRMHAQLGEIAMDVSDMKLRMSAMETGFGQQSLQIAALNSRMDRFDERLGRVERRLDLVDA